jgi:hypothetical protein
MDLPGAIIYINNDLNSALQTKIMNQLFIWELITEQTLLDRIASDPDYLITVRLDRKRILVTCNDIRASTTKTIVDVVLFVKSGLAYILKNNYGPPALTLPVERLYLNKLIPSE